MLNIELVVLTHRYLYYVLDNPVVSDAEYDALERKAVSLCPSDSPIFSVSSCMAADYPEQVKRRALRLLDIHRLYPKT